MNRRGMYSSAGIPGTGLYAVHHIRTGNGKHAIIGAADWIDAALGAIVIVSNALIVGLLVKH